MRRVFVWKVLSEDGLLKNHKEVGPYYDSESFDSEYETQEAAIDAYADFKKRQQHRVESEMVLLTVYKTN